MLIFGGTTAWEKEKGRGTGRAGEGARGEAVVGWALSADDRFLNSPRADLPGQRNGVTEMPQSSGVHVMLLRAGI